MNRTKHGTVTTLVVLAACLASPSVCHAHALHPAYYPLGPYVLFIPFSAPVGLLPVFMVIGIEAAMVRSMVSLKSKSGALGLSAVAFLASKAGESIPGIAILATASGVMWSSDSLWATVGAPLLIFGVGLAVNAALIWVWSRSQPPNGIRILGTASLLSITSYVVLLLSTYSLLHVGWMI